MKTQKSNEISITNQKGGPTLEMLDAQEARLKIEKWLLDNECARIKLRYDNISSTKASILKAFDSINAAYLSLYDSLSRLNLKTGTDVSFRQHEFLIREHQRVNCIFEHAQNHMLQLNVATLRANTKGLRLAAKRDRLNCREDRLRAERIYLMLNNISDSPGVATTGEKSVPSEDKKALMESINRLVNNVVEEGHAYGQS